jgi:outer membrane receptor protein involved in Fe transport
LQAYLANYMTDAEAQALAEQMAGIPVGTVEPAEIGASSEIIAGSVQGGTITWWGTDIGVDYWLSDAWLLRANYSWAPPSTQDLGPGRYNPDGYPRNRGLVALAYRPPGEGLTGLLEVRGQTEKEMQVGRYSGVVEGYVVVDLTLGYRFPGNLGLSAYLTGTNILDKRYVEIVGGKELGRLVMLRMQLDF